MDVEKKKTKILIIRYRIPLISVSSFGLLTICRKRNQIRKHQKPPRPRSQCNNQFIKEARFHLLNKRERNHKKRRKARTKIFSEDFSAAKQEGLR